MEQVSGWSEQGGSVVTIPGTQGSGSQRFQQSFRSATVTVRDSSNNLATIYSDDLASPTAKANPFTASSTTGSWSFFATTGTYTVTFSGASILAPFSITVNLGLGNAGGVPSYAFASLPTSKTQNAGDLAIVTNVTRGLWMDNGDHWFSTAFNIANALAFNGASITAQIDAAILGVPASGGIVLLPPGMGAGNATTVPNNVTLMDLRRSPTIVSIRDANVIFDSYGGTGTDEQFTAAFQVHLTAGGTAGNSGVAEGVGLFAAVDRASTSNRPGWAANFVASVQASARTNATYGLEIDFDNNDSDCSITSNTVDQQVGLPIISGGSFKPLAAIMTSASAVGGRWQIACALSDWFSFGLRIFQSSSAPAVTGPAIYTVPSSNGTNQMWIHRNAADNANVWELLQNGTQRFANNAQLQFFDVSPATTVGGIYMGGDGSLHVYPGVGENILFENHAGTLGVGVLGGSLVLAQAAISVSAGRVSIGSTVAATASAGGGQAALATVLGYLLANVAGTTVKIPYFAN